MTVWKVDKNNAELYLNDCPADKLPKQFRDLISQHNYHGKKYGSYIRRNHYLQFLIWFEQDFAPSNAQSNPSFSNGNVS